MILNMASGFSLCLSYLCLHLALTIRLLSITLMAMQTSGEKQIFSFGDITCPSFSSMRHFKSLSANFWYDTIFHQPLELHYLLWNYSPSVLCSALCSYSQLILSLPWMYAVSSLSMPSHHDNISYPSMLISPWWKLNSLSLWLCLLCHQPLGCGVLR